MGAVHQLSKREESHSAKSCVNVNDLVINIYFSIVNAKHLIYVNKTWSPYRSVGRLCTH